MKTTIDIPKDQLQEAIRWTGARTKREAVVTAITEFNRRKRLEKLADRLGTFQNVMSDEELQQMRQASI